MSAQELRSLRTHLILVPGLLPSRVCRAESQLELERVHHFQTLESTMALVLLVIKVIARTTT